MTDEPSLERAAELVRAGLKEARAALYAIADPQQALDTARAFVTEMLREVRMSLADSRAEQAARIVDDEGMALSVLGRKMGGKTRQAAHKEVTRGRKARASAEEEITT